MQLHKNAGFFAVASYLLIPVVTITAGIGANAINLEMAGGQPDYERWYWLLNQLRYGILAAGFLAGGLLWLLTCWFLLKARHRSFWWLLLALLGPPGFMIVCMLGSTKPADVDLHQRFTGNLTFLQRIAYELGLFVAALFAAFLAMLLTRTIQIQLESIITGVPTAQIMAIQNASSGMWAFAEGAEIMFLMVLFYLVWPFIFNSAGRLLNRAGSRR